MGDREIGGVIGKFGVPGVNESGEKMTEMCNELGLLIGNTCFKKRMIHKYTWERMAHGVVVDRAMMDYVVVSKHMRGRLLDVNVLRGVASGMSDHFLVEGRVKVNGRFVRRERRDVKEVVKVDELEKDENRERYEEKMKSRWERKRNEECGGIEEEWECLRDSMKVCAEEVCGRKKMGGTRRKGCEWWNERIERIVKEKKERYERYLQDRGREAYEEYKRKRAEVKRLIKEAKKEADERWGSRLMRDFGSNKKMFWKEVKRERKDCVGRSVGIKDVNGDKLVSKEDVNKRWAEYFEELLNVQDDREAIIVGVGNGRRMPVCERCNDEIEYNEVWGAVRGLKGGKAPGVDEVVAE